MKSSHSKELKALLQKREASRSGVNPQCSGTSCMSSTSYQCHIKRSESASTLRRRGLQLVHIQQRYRLLESNYNALQRQMKLKSELDRKQEEEIERYRRDNARSSMEIDRLKKMMGKVRAKDAAVQATFTKLNSSSMTSIVDKIQIRTPSPLIRQPIQVSNTPGSKTLKKSNYRQRQDKTQAKSQFSKYKFVPTLRLQMQ